VTIAEPSRFDPELRQHLVELSRVELWDLDQVRLGTVASALEWDPSVRVTSFTVPGAAGAPDVPVRLYDGRLSSRDHDGVLHVHGGAFVSGSPDFEHRRSMYLARGARCLVVSVDYRLAPEHRYPAGFEDCCAALDWMTGAAGELGIDPRRVGVAGSSAGGCLAAALALRGRNGDGPPVAFQLLVYPALDCRCSSPSMRRFSDIPGFSGRNASQMWSLYLPEGGGADAYASPALASALAGLPPAFVSVAEFDPLRDEGIDFALRLLGSSVAVELRVFPGTWHGFDLVAPGTAAALSFERAEVDALRRLVGTLAG